MTDFMKGFNPGMWMKNKPVQQMTPRLYKLAFDCISWPTKDMEALSDMINNARKIRRSSFLKYVSTSELALLEAALGYAPRKSLGLTMNNDFHVRYYTSKLYNRVVYFITQSAIEHIFVHPDDVDFISKGGHE